MVQDLNPGRNKIFLFFKTSRQSLRPTQPSVEGVPALFSGFKAAGV
jgi:hypothetical protein